MLDSLVYVANFEPRNPLNPFEFQKTTQGKILLVEYTFRYQRPRIIPASYRLPTSISQATEFGKHF